MQGRLKDKQCYILIRSFDEEGKTKGVSARSRHVYSKERYDNLEQNLLKDITKKLSVALVLTKMFTAVPTSPIPMLFAVKH